MNEKTKKFWGKSRRLPPSNLVRFGLFVCVFGGCLATALSASGAAWNFSNALIASVVGGAIVLGVCVVVRSLCCWRNLRRFLFATVCFGTLIALVYAEENFRGKWAWNNFKSAQEAKGEKFDLASLVPPPVPDDQNFAMQPIWVEEISGTMGTEKARSWYGDRVAALTHTNRVPSLEMPLELFGRGLEFTNRPGNWQMAEKTDLKAWQVYYRTLATITNSYPVPSTPQTPAEDVLLALSKYDSALERLRVASELPFARFPVSYADDNPAAILLPHLASLKGCALMLQLRAIAELQSNQTGKALADVKLMLRLAEAVRVEPFLISHLVHIALLNIALQPVWEGLADHKWSDAQLVALDAEWGKLDLLADYHLAMHAERAFGVTILDYLRRHRAEIFDLTEGYYDYDHGSRSTDGNVKTTVYYLVPGGWFDQNKISMGRMFNEYFLPIVNLETRVCSVTNEVRATEAVDRLVTGRSPYSWFADVFLPTLPNASRRFVQAQAATDEARIAIALERHRLALGKFPETLAALTPQFMDKLPHDLVNGQPLKYRRSGDDGFILYSVGCNEKDDGGKFVLSKNGQSVNWQEGDWVWQLPEK